MEISIRVSSGDEIRLKAVHFPDNPEEINIYRLVPLTGGKVYLVLEVRNNKFEILEKAPEVVEDIDVLREKLDELIIAIQPQTASIGTEDNEVEPAETSPYDPERIRVDTKQFSLRQIFDMIQMEDIDLAPDFQRNLVWDSARKSLLIESILLRIPLPMFYFAQDEDGKISVVDGLQRLSTINSFMRNEFSLNNLEYLGDKCKGKFYSSKNIDGTLNSLPVIDAKYFRWFNMTQITVNVIDPSSPFKLKYDIFRRINTGGQPLNSQEIRNCLASRGLRNALREMSSLRSFNLATGGSIKDVRMESQELALRFILFVRKYKSDPSLNNYSGNIESELNTLTEDLNKDKGFDYTEYIQLYDKAMKNAFHLFGEYSFRKCLPMHLQPKARKQLINKAIFVSWSVLLAFVNENSVLEFPQGILAQPLADKLASNLELLHYLTYSTNSKTNIQAAFKAADEILSKYFTHRRWRL